MLAQPATGSSVERPDAAQDDAFGRGTFVGGDVEEVVDAPRGVAGEILSMASPPAPKRASR